MTGPIRILVTGGSGQVGLELARSDAPTDWILVRPSRDLLDISSESSVEAYLAQGDWAAIISCAAWTAVDLAEDQAGQAFLANCQGPANLAVAAKRMSIPIVHLSTDYVFDGQLGRPYRESDAVAPLGVYGASKLAGELAINSVGSRAVILRTAWVISAQRNNFLKTMLRIGKTKTSLQIVSDQHGCPTSAADIAAAAIAIVKRLIEDPKAPTGIYHFVNSGETTWCDLARQIFACSAARGGPSPEVIPIAAADYPTRASRPANSRLDTAKLTAAYGIVPRPWQEAVADITAELIPSAQIGVATI